MRVAKQERGVKLRKVRGWEFRLYFRNLIVPNREYWDRLGVRFVRCALCPQAFGRQELVFSFVYPVLKRWVMFYRPALRDWGFVGAGVGVRGVGR
jgi:hypothetical protein